MPPRTTGVKTELEMDSYQTGVQPIPPVVHCRLQDVDELLVARKLRRDDREDVPVVLLHDVQHQQRLLLDGGAKLEERRLHVLKKEGRKEGEGEETKEISLLGCSLSQGNSIKLSTHTNTHTRMCAPTLA